MTDNHVLADAEDRRAIAENLDATVFVNAGAGSGKTHALVTRIVNLVLGEKPVPVRSIAAVTFTEKAGAELRARIRRNLEEAALASADNERARRAAHALEDLDAAAIGTLHSFAQRILAEHAIEAGLPPVFEVMDEAESAGAFEETWAQIRSEMLGDESLLPWFDRAEQIGGTIDLGHLQAFAERLNDDWDLIESRVLTVDAERRYQSELQALIRQCDDVATRRDEKGLTKAQKDRIDIAAALCAELRGHSDDDDAVADVLARFPEVAKRLAKSPDPGTVPADLRAIEAFAARIVPGRIVRTLLTWLARRVLVAAKARRGHGTLQFHDLLVTARRLVRTRADVRATLQARYQRILLDEFQDSDPIQIELAVLIAGGAGATQDDWQDVIYDDGRLFFVGDAKQSIYRFRRADIATYLKAETAWPSTDSRRLETNFRTVNPILAWVNATFAQLIVESDGKQPAYSPLTAYRTVIPDDAGPAVTLLGGAARSADTDDQDTENAATDEGEEKAASVNTLLAQEAADVAFVIAQACDDAARWKVRDEASRSGTETWRPITARDIVILIPTRKALPFLEKALDERGINHAAVSSSLVYSGREVRDLLACVRALADRSDEAALVAVFRSALFGCGDDDLWRWKNAGHRFSLNSRIPTDLSQELEPVGSAIIAMQELAAFAADAALSALLERIITDRRMLEVAAHSTTSARSTWHRLRLVVDHARRWEQRTEGGLRAYLAWASRQADPRARVVETVLPDDDVDAVRIMTIHAAKGLEFPTVILAGSVAPTTATGGAALHWTPNGYEAAITKEFGTMGMADAIEDAEEHERAESLRLLYVGATRAMDHLVVPVRPGPSKLNKNQREPFADIVDRAMKDAGETAAAHLVEAPDLDATPLVVSDHVPTFAVTSDPDYTEWVTRHESVIAASQRDGVITASSLEPRVSPGRAADAAEPVHDRATGQRIGTAVHAILEQIDLTTHEGLDALVVAHTADVKEHAGTVASLVRAALDSEVLQAAACHDHWREIYVATERDGVVVEGYIDLMLRDDDGTLVIVDYKTDIDQTSLVERYGEQQLAYADAVAAATGARTRSRLLAISPAGAVAEVTLCAARSKATPAHHPPETPSAPPGSRGGARSRLAHPGTSSVSRPGFG